MALNWNPDWNPRNTTSNTTQINTGSYTIDTSPFTTIFSDWGTITFDKDIVSSVRRIKTYYFIFYQKNDVEHIKGFKMLKEAENFQKSVKNCRPVIRMILDNGNKITANRIIAIDKDIKVWLQQ